MRIIDADVLPSALFQKHVHDGEELEPMMYFEDAVKVVENAPTIDAIPVEWLRERKHWAAIDGDHWAENIIRYLLDAWQKEQGAKK